MKSVLVVYATTEGQTGRIASFVADRLRAGGVKVDLIDSDGRDAALVQPVYAGVIACGSLHKHRFQPSLERFVAMNNSWLSGVPSALVSVSLTAKLTDDASRSALRAIDEDFARRTGWSPAITCHVAGALRYSRYGVFTRLLMRLIAAREGGDTDTSRDHEYTDWDDLARFVDEWTAATGLREAGHVAAPARAG